MSSDSDSDREDTATIIGKLETGLSARPYQTELVKMALEKNIIVCLGTGTGKTFISVMLIKELGFQVRKSLEEGGKRTFFLVNTVPLAKQQKEVIEKNTDLRVKDYIGAMGVDDWDDSRWAEELAGNQVLVMTAQIFVDLLGHGRIILSDVNLIVFDECHHARKEHPYKQVMRYFDDTCHTLPRVMGLTASIINTKETHKIDALMNDLEATMRAVCQTSADEAVGRYATKPEEILYPYSNSQDISEVERELSDMLKEKVLIPWQEFIDDFRVSALEEKPAFKSIKSLVNECVDTLDELGASAANQVAEYLIKDLGRAEMFTHNDTIIWLYQYCQTQLRQFRKIYSIHTAAYAELEYGLTHVSPKVKALVEILKQYGTPHANSEEEPASKLCGIVFVERRYTALILCDQINQLARRHHELAFVKCNFVIGHGAGGVGYSKETEMNIKKQEKVLRQFRSHKTNLLIATSVVEEGIDVPKCNFVVRFDFPNNYRSYVQSKGRARAKNSSYIMLVEEKKMEALNLELERYRDTEQHLLEVCHNRELPTPMDSEMAVYVDWETYRTPRGARLSLSNSISFLQSYCSKLPGDQYTKLLPEIETVEEGIGAFRSTIMLPMNCLLKEKIRGEVMTRKDLSRQAAAFDACVRLHQMGELDDNLKPVVDLSDESLDESDSEGEEKKAKSGTKKRKRTYARKVPDVLTDSLPRVGQQCYLYAINITEGNRPLQELGTLWKLGIAVTKSLPPIRRFHIFLDTGPVVVTIQPDGATAARLTDNQLRLIESFHAKLVSQVLRMTHEITAGQLDGYHLVLLGPTRGTLDFGQMRQLEALMAHPRGESEAQTSERIIDFDNLESGNSLIKPLHRQEYQKYVLERVCFEKSPRSPFPDQSKARTYAEYYKATYNQTITLDTQPLLEVRNFSERVNFLVDRKKTADKKSKKPIHLIPELCSQDPLPASLLRQACLLPSILRRMTSFLLVLELREKIETGCDVNDKGTEHAQENSLPVIGSAPVARASAAVQSTDVLPSVSRRHRRGKSNTSRHVLSADDKHEREFGEVSETLRFMFSNKRRGLLHPDSELLLQALTSTNAGDAFDLERLEMLGDAFLKQAVSIYLYCCYKDKDEGKLTKRKGGRLSNRALFRDANRLGLPEYLQSTQLDRFTWAPSSLRLAEAADGVRGSPKKARKLGNGSRQDSPDESTPQDAGATRNKATTQVISDKSVADSVEALIGAYLTSCGYEGALHFLDYLGVEVLPDEEMLTDDDREPLPCNYSTYQHPGITQYNPNSEILERMSQSLENFEERIGYIFNNKLYLIQALTHASYQENRLTDCYQRLEFLGDALLDFLVTEFIYSRNTRLSPGELTDLRQALVNNNIFAEIAVKYGYNKSLFQMSPEWFRKISTFVDVIEENEEEGEEINADPFLNLAEGDEEGIEAPKVLGDIFESVAGAIFLDSGMDVVTTWRVYYRMMKPYIDTYSKNVPKSPVRMIHEKDSDAFFSKATVLDNGKVECTLTVFWGTFKGRGANNRNAKMTAAKRALQQLEKLQQ